MRPELAALARVAYLTGWRKTELTSRRWTHVDFSAGWLRLDPEETKNREGRQFPSIPELRTVLEGQRARVDTIQKTTGRVVPAIFAREDGRPVRDFRRAWDTACRRAGFFRMEAVGEVKDGMPPRTRTVSTKLVHDFRRSAVRNLIRAGIPDTVAMALTGHKTRSVFMRYAIVDEGMLREAGVKLAAAALASAGQRERPDRITALPRRRTQEQSRGLDFAPPSPASQRSRTVGPQNFLTPSQKLTAIAGHSGRGDQLPGDTVRHGRLTRGYGLTEPGRVGRWHVRCLLNAFTFCDPTCDQGFLRTRRVRHER